MPDIPSKFQKDPSITFRVILWTHRQTNKQKPAKTLPLGGGKYMLPYAAFSVMPHCCLTRKSKACI